MIDHTKLTAFLLSLLLTACSGEERGDQGASESPEITSLEGTSWQLVQIHGINDSVFVPRNPENYLLRFRRNNRLEVEADCNTAGASWQQDGDALTLEELVTTRKLCVAPSLFNRYIMNLGNVQSMEMRDDRLVLSTTPTGGRLEFEPYVFVPGGA